MRTLCLVLVGLSLGAAYGPQERANPIDVHFEEAWKASDRTPGKPASDAILFRRLSLDLRGRLPLEKEIKAFLKKPDRTQAIADMLQSYEAQVYYADLWIQWMFDYDFEVIDLYSVDFGAFHRWLGEQFKNDRPYNEFVGELMSVANA